MVGEEALRWKALVRATGEVSSGLLDARHVVPSLVSLFINSMLTIKWPGL